LTTADFNFFSPREVKALLDIEHLHLSKRYGQNFLIDRNIALKIIDSMDLKPTDRVLEIGPGIGTMTGLLLDRSAGVTAVEVDKGLVRVLNGLFPGNPSLKIIHADFLELDSEQLAGIQAVKVYSSLPYSTASQILIRLAISTWPIQEITVMLPEEIVRRLKAGPGNESYGIMAVFIQSCFRLSDPGIRAGKKVFFPEPKIDSRVLKLIPDNQTGHDPGQFLKFVSGAFRARRKKARPVLESLLEKEKVAFLFDRFHISDGARPGDIEPGAWREIHKASLG
jgi:16S rRNA (adenine1518-N6/adenine1519-N6)-dimethyltransferase